MNEASITTYCGLLEEIKYRTEAIQSLLAGQLPVRAKIGEELCYLQLRMICELIALGCLVIHGDLKPKAKLYRTYKADWIISELEKLHPQFYPTPLENEDDHSDAIPSWRHKKSGFLTRQDLSKLWNREAGSKLHRGSVKNILAKDDNLSLSTVKSWLEKVISLLNRHIIISPDEKQIYYFVMQSKNSGSVDYNIFSLRSDR
ncbi:hypothetical protein KK137_06375 [Croceibacterium sp. LX-88]|uniref:Uncharacterized protein n=1 Tax=Croceibacterium selenioxidans TaxID=2838833 RepID=A0ABS5W2I7_9SPHN|nr:hypothetical protein [Croceibacterium selenioxidans]MBT2133955.1 hypothetical protein [Croceibacterium selenioxidans]